MAVNGSTSAVSSAQSNPPLVSRQEQSIIPPPTSTSESRPEPAIIPASSEPVISQVLSVPPLNPNVSGPLDNDQYRSTISTGIVSTPPASSVAYNFSAGLQRELEASAALSGFNAGLGQLRGNLSNNSGSFSTAVTSPIPASSTDPFSMSRTRQLFTGGSSGAQGSGRAHGINPGTAPLNRGLQGTARVTTPFSLGNRNLRTEADTSGGIRRRLDTLTLKNIVYEPQSGTVASEEKMRAVALALIEMGIPEEKLTEVGVYLARHCADVGSSDKSTLLGNFPYSDITLEEVGAKIKQTAGCTLRQYCAYYAKYVWNLMHQTFTPPANWSGKNFKFETRYAAFDFFFGVDSPAALEPQDGVLFAPTQAERVANATSKEIRMFRIMSVEGTQAVNFGEVTGGKIGPKPVLTIRK